MKKKNICFISNYYKTQVFVEIAKTLKNHNIESFWIIPNKKQYDELQDIFPINQLLYIGKKEVLSTNNSIETSIDFKINELVYGDRVLKHEPSKWSYDYLNKLSSLYSNFIIENNISYVFGELTWAHELIAFRLLSQDKSLNCKFINPHTIRIPNGRFTFFTNEFQSNILETENNANVKDDFIKLEKPAYLALNDKLLAKKGTISHSLVLLKNFILRTNQDANDPTLYSNPYHQFKIRTAEIYNRIIFKNFVTETKIETLPKDKKRVLFTLHKQPEASIDVIGRYYENQLDLIHNIWRILPKDYVLLVKEHSNAIGDRDFSFYKSVKNLRNVYLIDNKADTHKLLDSISAVFTVSGTIAYEAALKSKHSFTFAPTFFNKLKGCKQIAWSDFKENSLDNLIKENTEGLDHAEFSKWLLQNSYEGIMSDSFGDPRCVMSENIECLSKAFLTIID
ncbi:hypothetical protein [Winogradskyella ludwigii]|uniref:hypothetical protein n=1 Tax=Winogradskyella ludwigii TaxID=2686076 RepID=UPI0015CD87C7|nr:hypothetical protein [Winogradskyella ludwigii]